MCEDILVVSSSASQVEASRFKTPPGLSSGFLFRDLSKDSSFERKFKGFRNISKFKRNLRASFLLFATQFRGCAS